MKVLGASLIVIGTTIGAGILALPLATAAGGFWYSVILLMCCWVASTFSAFLMVEVNLWLPEGSNIISMAKMTMGTPGKILSWFFYLLLLYALTSAYVSGGADVLHGLLAQININIPMSLAAIIFTLFFGYIVYLGIQKVDYFNRFFMSLKLIVFVLLVIFISPYVKTSIFPANHLKPILSAVTVAITSFGYSIVIPSLRQYFHSDIKKIRITLLAGSILPLIFYIVWEICVFGVVHAGGAHGLVAISQGGQTTTRLVAAIVDAVQSTQVKTMAHLFTSICMITSFLGVSLSLKDFLFDGFNAKQTLNGRIFVYAFTFLPVLAIVLFLPSIFIIAIRYAGLSCIILLILFPIIMAYRGRYHLNQHGYRVLARGGKPLLMFFAIVAIALMVLSGF